MHLLGMLALIIWSSRLVTHPTRSDVRKPLFWTIKGRNTGGNVGSAKRLACLKPRAMHSMTGVLNTAGPPSMQSSLRGASWRRSLSEIDTKPSSTIQLKRNLMDENEGLGYTLISRIKMEMVFPKPILSFLTNAY